LLLRVRRVLATLGIRRTGSSHLQILCDTVGTYRGVLVVVVVVVMVVMRMPDLAEIAVAMLRI